MIEKFLAVLFGDKPKPTEKVFCCRCEHLFLHRHFADDEGWFCRANPDVFHPRTNYVTGQVAQLPPDYHRCNFKNSDGKCPDYKEKES